MKASDMTIMVCSCDAYEDTWYPFFKLFSKYWPDCPYEIILNTESKIYEYPGLNIKTFSFYKNGKVPYGKRMLRHLKEVKTPYLLVLMDDFFFRDDVKQEEIEKVKNYLASDKRAVVFSFQDVVDELNEKSAKYDGYYKRPKYGEYKLNFQPAVWKTSVFQKTWSGRGFASPWDWEQLVNFRVCNDKFDFYVLPDVQCQPINYGYNCAKIESLRAKWGVYRGKWVVDTVKDLFEENGIEIDYSIRGVYDVSMETNRAKKNKFVAKQWIRLRCVGLLETFKYIGWLISRSVRKLCKHSYADNYLLWQRQKEKKKSALVK